MCAIAVLYINYKIYTNTRFHQELRSLHCTSFSYLKSLLSQEVMLFNFQKCHKIAEALHLFPAQSYKLSPSLVRTVTPSAIHHAKPPSICTACISLKGDKA